MGEYAQEQYRRFKAYLARCHRPMSQENHLTAILMMARVGWKLLNPLGDWVQRRRCRREFRRAKEEARS